MPERERSPHGDGDLVAWSVNVGQARWHRRPWCNAARDSYPYLVHSGNAGSFTKRYDLGHATADDDLWRYHTFTTQAGAGDVQNLSRSGGIVGRGNVGCAGVKDRALPSPIPGERNKCRRGHQYLWSVDLCAGKASPENPDASVGDAPGEQNSPILEEGGRMEFAIRSHIACREKDPR